jgi:hypothetical protein
MKSTVILIAAVVLSSIFAMPAAGQARHYAGRSVADVLRELQSRQLRIIFSSDLVPPALSVKSEPKAGTARQIALQILAPHGLTLVPGPRDTMLVVAAKPGPAPPPGSPDAVPASASAPAPPQTQNEIRLEERVDVIDELDAVAAEPEAYPLEPAKIRDTAGGLEDVRRVLQLMPGVAATNDRDGRMAVRGGGPEHNLIVVDGVQIHNPHRLGEFTSSFLNPATAARVALDASGLEARHGGRLSSVTVIETRDGRRDRRLAVSGSLGLTSGDVLLEGRLPKTVSGSWWATARGTYYRAVMDKFGDAVPGFGDVQFKLTVRPTPHTRLTGFGLLGRETARELSGAPDVGAIDGAAPSTPTLREGDMRPVGVHYAGVNRVGVVTFSWTPRPQLASTTSVSAYAHDARDYDASLLIAGIEPFERKVQVSDFAVRQRLEFVPAAHHLIDAGVELHRIGSSWRMFEVKHLDTPRGLGPSTGGELIDYSHGPIDARLNRTQAGFWLQYRLPLGTVLAAEPGVRLEWNSFTREASPQPRIRVSARIGRTTVWAGAAVQAQTPSHEMLQGFDYFDLTADAGERLRNERSRQIVGGVEQTFGGGFSLRAETYRRRFDRLLVQRLETDAERAARLASYALPSDLPPDSVVLERRPTVAPESTGKGAASGIELLLTRQGRLSGSLAYAYSKSTREMHGHTFLFDFDRPHAVTALASVQITRRIRASMTWQRASGFPVTPVREEVRFTRLIFRDGTVDPMFRAFRRTDGALVTSPSPAMRRLSLRNSERLNHYARADFRASHSGPGPWEFYFEVLNVFNRWNHVQQIQHSSFERGLGGLVSENNVYAQFERLPSFGVRVAF